MADMLVKLYALPDLHPYRTRLAEQGIEIRLAHPIELATISSWIRTHFSERWAREAEVAIARRPIGCYVAVALQPHTPTASPYELAPELLVGFACYDVVAKGLFGPTGVREDYRGRGIGTALLLACLDAMRTEGYAYAAIAWAGPRDFYAKTVGATVIEGSEPGVYRGTLIVE